MSATLPRGLAAKSDGSAPRRFGVIVASLFVCLGLAVVGQQGGTSSSGPLRTNWADYLGGPDGSHFSDLSEINRTNVDKLQVAWKYENPGGGSTSPLAVDGVVYVAAKGGALVALNGATGEEIWTYQFTPPPGGMSGGRAPVPDVAGAAAEAADAVGRAGIPPVLPDAANARGRAGAGAVAPAGRGGGRGGVGITTRGINYWESKDRSDRRILVTAGGALQAINAQTGKLIDTFGDHGRVDLRTGIERNNGQPVTSRTAGRVFENLIMVGSATGEGYLSPPGDLRAFDVVTGKLAWVFHTVPRPGEFGYDTWPKEAWKYIGGVNAWGEITVDEKRGIAYFPLGSPTYDFYGADRHGAGLFGDSLLALDARTGKYKWHYQLIHHDLWDYDAVSAPQLITIRQNGRTIDAVAQASKQGFLFVFERETGKPVWPIEERPVPQSTMPGEKSWPTQPFPTNPPPFAKQKFTADDLDPALTPAEQTQWREKLKNAVDHGLFTPPAFQRDTVMMPGHNGGANFYGAASDPARGLVYVVTKNLPALINIGERQGRGGDGGGRGSTVTGTPAQMGRAVYAANCQSCHGPELEGTAIGPRLHGAVERRTPAGTMALLKQGAGLMPSFASLPGSALDNVLTFLSDPSAAPAASQPAIQAPVAERPYPREAFEAPPPRYDNRAPTGGLSPTAIKPPWSTLTAYDLNRGTIVWQVPYGDAPQMGPNPGTDLRGGIWQRSGPIITAGGLIFLAQDEGVLRVLDSSTGKQIRMPIDLPRGSQGVPLTYLADGRQFVVVSANAGPRGSGTGAPGFGGPGVPVPGVGGGGGRGGGAQPPGEVGAYVAFAVPKK